MIIKNIEQKVKLSLIVSIGAFVTSLLIVGVTLYFSYGLINESRKQIYVLDGTVPVMVRQTDVDVNREVEYKSHINLFHLLFFTLPPDDEFIKSNIAKSMYLIDQSGLTEYNNLKERGYYNAIMASSAALSIHTDSVRLDMKEHSFTYYGTQRIERETSILKRQLITTGHFKDVPRSENNPHGGLITGWKTVLNKDLSLIKKSDF
jgi:conjugative transposon TraK protein